MRSLFIITAFLLPLVAWAQSIQTLIESLGGLVATAIPILVGIALLVFFWGIVKFIASAGDAEERKKGRQFIVGGIIALFVMISVWGIVRFIGDALGIGTGEGIEPPYFPGGGSGSDEIQL